MTDERLAVPRDDPRDFVIVGRRRPDLAPEGAGPRDRERPRGRIEVASP